jgi:formate dehydrogenase iron-sulfur subunit
MIKKAEQRVNEIKDRYPNAMVYNPQGVGGTHTVYVLAEKPSVYGLPENPKVPTSAVLWKDYAQPIGKMMIGATTMAVVGAFISNKIFSKKDNNLDEDGGGSHE